MYNCVKHESTFISDKCPSCKKEKNRKTDTILSVILCIICNVSILITFGWIVAMYCLIAGASFYLVAENRFKDE